MKTKHLVRLCDKCAIIPALCRADGKQWLFCPKCGQKGDGRTSNRRAISAWNLRDAVYVTIGKLRGIE